MNTGLWKDSTMSASYLQHKILFPAGLVTSHGHCRALHILHFQGHVRIEFIWGMRHKMLSLSSYPFITWPATFSVHTVHSERPQMKSPYGKISLGLRSQMFKLFSTCIKFSVTAFSEIQAQMNKNTQLFTCSKTGTKSVKCYRTRHLVWCCSWNADKRRKHSLKAQDPL